ncbi:MAG: hypothetical protein ACTSUE_04915, partial [Promethearchaeota archaeon]
GTLLGLFLLQTFKAKKFAPYLTVSLAFGCAAGFVQVLHEFLGMFDPVRHQLNLTMFGLMLFFFYLFLENLESPKPPIPRFSIAFGLLFLELLTLWLIYWFQNFPNSSEFEGIMWFLTDLGYNFLGLFTFAFFGFYHYIRAYKYSKDARDLSLSVCMVVVGIGYTFLLSWDLVDFFNITVEWLDNFTEFGLAFPVIGLLIMVITYLSNINYLARLPYDNFVLTVGYKSGVPIHTVCIETLKRKVIIQQEMLTGLLSAISTMFRSTLGTETDIHQIRSKDASILMESGKYVVAIIVSDKVSATLIRAMKRYVTEFERMFEVKLLDNVIETNQFDAAKGVLGKVFPFFKIQEIK